MRESHAFVRLVLPEQAKRHEKTDGMIDAKTEAAGKLANEKKPITTLLAALGHTVYCRSSIQLHGH
jgi:hypothetical protein